MEFARFFLIRASARFLSKVAARVPIERFKAAEPWSAPFEVLSWMFSLYLNSQK